MNPETVVGCHGLKIIPNSYFLQAFCVPTLFWFPQTWWKGKISLISDAILMRISCVSHGWALALRTAKAQHQLGLKVPVLTSFIISTMKTPWEEPGHPRQPRCTQDTCLGLAHTVQNTVDTCTALEWQLELGRRPWNTWKGVRHQHLGVWVALLGSVSVKIAYLILFFWANLNVHWVRSLWHVNVVMWVMMLGNLTPDFSVCSLHLDFHRCQLKGHSLKWLVLARGIIHGFRASKSLTYMLLFQLFYIPVEALEKSLLLCFRVFLMTV